MGAHEELRFEKIAKSYLRLQVADAQELGMARQRVVTERAHKA